MRTMHCSLSEVLCAHGVDTLPVVVRIIEDHKK